MTENYLPPGTESLKDIKLGPIRLGLQGPPGSGKTFAALTFPSPIVADFDNALHDHFGKDIPRIPFWEPDFILNRMEWKDSEGKLRKGFPLETPIEKRHQIPNRRDAFKMWLKQEAIKFSPSQTLILDSWTTLQDAFDAKTWAEPTYAKKTGEIDEYAPWDAKITYSEEIVGILSGLRCNVVVNFHEIQQRDPKTGILLDKTQPLMQGKFIAKLKLYFPFFFRQFAPNENRTLLPKNYVWQVSPNEAFDPKCCSEKLRTQGVVLANYKSFER